jgi:hypothetical protein
MEAMSSSETLVETQQTTGRYIPEDGLECIYLVVEVGESTCLLVCLPMIRNDYLAFLDL